MVCLNAVWRPVLISGQALIFDLTSKNSLLKVTMCCFNFIHNSIQKICPTFQILSLHFEENEFTELFNAMMSMSTKQNMCKEKIFQLRSMSNAITYLKKVCSQEFWYILSGLDIQHEQSQIPRMKIQHASNSFKVVKYDMSYTVFSVVDLEYEIMKYK